MEQITFYCVDNVDEFKARVSRLQLSQESGEPLFVKFIGGNYAGSIARMPYDKVVTLRLQPGTRGKVYCSLSDSPRQCVWDGKRNNIRADLGRGEIVWLPGYTGPTVLKRFDRKKAKAKLLKNAVMLDIDGETLEVGDSVLYLNIRYGEGSSLAHGSVCRFEADASPSGGHVFTIVKREDSEEESRISDSAIAIWKKGSK